MPSFVGDVFEAAVRDTKKPDSSAENVKRNMVSERRTVGWYHFTGRLTVSSVCNGQRFRRQRRSSPDDWLYYSDTHTCIRIGVRVGHDNTIKCWQMFMDTRFACWFAGSCGHVIFRIQCDVINNLGAAIEHATRQLTKMSKTNVFQLHLLHKKTIFCMK